MLLAQLDGNIVVAALPSIAADVNAGTTVAGVLAAYLLTVTVTTPVAGKLGDVVGRRLVFVGSILVFATGSLACALSDSMLALILARAVQGIGGSGLVVTAISSLGELFDKSELVRRQIWLTAIMAISALAGPPLGGFVATVWGWPAIFFINLPVCVVALAIGARGLPATAARSSLRNFDVAGTALIAVVASAIVVLGSFDGLGSSPVWAPGLVTLAVAGTVAFVARERHASDPLIPPELFASAVLTKAITATGLSGIALFGTFAFIPLAVIAGTGYGTAAVSAMLIALTGGQLAVTATFSVVARRYPRMVPWGRLGLAIGVVGLGLMAVVPLLSERSPAVVVALTLVGLALSGAALALSMQAFTLLGLTTAPRTHLGSAMATLTFVRQLGGSIGSAAFGWLLITLPTSPTALSVVLGLAALALVVGLALAPGRADESEPSPA
ncbi:MAG: MFS transporter [Actinomycetota bacterium]|nr:MAG: MFS transporter [Actinomycetota bacterium]